MTGCLPSCVFCVAWALPVTLEAIDALRADTHLTELACVAWLTQARPADVVALGAVQAAARLATVQAERANWALVLAPAVGKRGG